MTCWGTYKSCTWERITLCNRTGWAVTGKKAAALQKRHWGGLIDNRLDVCPCSKGGCQPIEQMWSQKIMGGISPTPPLKHFWGCSWSTVSGLGYPVQGRHWYTGASTAEGLPGGSEGWNAFQVRMCFLQPSEEKTKEKTSCCGQCRVDKEADFSLCTVER